MFRIFGPPGTGKTTTLLNMVDRALEEGTPPERIAFLAFTRKAANEARDRAAARFNLDPKKDLIFFRTLHSLALTMSDIRPEQVMQEQNYKELSRAMGVELGGQKNKEIKVKSIIPGIVAEVLFKVGDAVKLGAPLFKISPNPTPLEYVEARRSMELAEVTMQKLKNDWTRQLELYKGNLISRSEMDAAEGSYRETELRFRTAAERLELLEKGRIRMSNRDIDSLLRSPITGIVLSQSVFQGDPVVPLTNFQPGTELCSLADMASLLFKGTVDEIDVGKIVEGMETEIQIGALPDTKIPGRVDRIFPKAKKEGNATLFDIWIVIKETAGVTLRAGFSATAGIQIRERKQVVLIPERLVVFEDGKRFVEVPDSESKGEQKTRKIEIQTGLSDGLNIEVLSGLKEGDKVVEKPPREIK